jgi:arsenate reductase (thioredoxin)
MGDRRLGELEQRHELADADLAGVLSKDVDELHSDRVAERLRYLSHPFALGPLDVGVGDRLAARLAGGALLLRDQLQIDCHLFEYINSIGYRRLSMPSDIPEVLFVCVHNAGRSQMAAGFLRKLAGDRVRVRTAGSEPAAEINPVAVEAMREVGVGLSDERPKPLTNGYVREADVVITMGCGDACPIYPGKRYEDWELEDPAGKDIETVRRIRDEIDARVKTLVDELASTL